MITHTTCGETQSQADMQYYPLVATTIVASDNLGKPYSTGPHNVVQVFKRIGDKDTLPTMFCSKCGKWAPFGEFVFAFVCSKCGEHPKIYFLADFCLPHGLREVCIKCAAKLCLKCKKQCKPFKYFYDNYWDQLRKLEGNE